MGLSFARIFPWLLLSVSTSICAKPVETSLQVYSLDPLEQLVERTRTNPEKVSYFELSMQVAKEIYPELNRETILKLRKDFQATLVPLKRAFNEMQTPKERVRILNRFVFGELRLETFHDGNTGAEHPDQYFPHAVLSGKKGVCLGLSSIYLWIAEELGLPLQPWHAPGHIFIRYEAAADSLNIESTDRGRSFDLSAAERKAGITNPQLGKDVYFKNVGKLGVLSDWLNAAAWCSAVGTARNPLSKERAILAARLSVKLNPQNYNNWDTLAEAYRYSDKPSEAWEALQKAATLFPDVEKYTKETFWQERMRQFEHAAGAVNAQAPTPASTSESP